MTRDRPDGHWLIAGTPGTEPYPCLCPPRGHTGNKFCPCWGRQDLGQLPANCCAPTWTPRPTPPRPTTKDT